MHLQQAVNAPARLLVVDDDRDVCDLVADVFSGVPDVAITSCTDARDALEHISYKPVDVVLTDLFMGRYSGMDVLEAVKGSHPDAVVIMMTGQPSVENALAAMRQGAYDYILKPFDIHSLRRTVQRGIERRRLWLENVHLTELVTLYQLSHAATSQSDIPYVAQLALNAVWTEFQPELAVLFLAKPSGDSSEAVAALGSPSSEDEVAFFSGTDDQSLQARMTGEPVIRFVTPAPRRPGQLGDVALKACRIAYPILVHERLMGLINIQCPPRPEPINAGDLKTLAILSGQVGSALENRRLLERLQSAYIDMVHALASALDARDRTTREHTDRVCHLAEAIARQMDWPEERIPELWLGCVLHDIGKIGVPDTILQKPGPLTAEEFELMKTHPVCGARMVEAIPYLQPAIPYILHHHEKYDGTGYPHGLKGDDIPIEARLLAVVDTFDAIISDRPYRKGRSVAVALAEIQAYSGTQFDPKVVAAFMRAWADGKIDQGRVLFPRPGRGRGIEPEVRIQLA
jgi:response regulator RpfG family c-di-GMP phosphodiesterase